MRGHCKKCSWPWHMYGNNEPDFCDHCFEDPRTDYRPLVLFDEDGSSEGYGENIRVLFKLNADIDRIGECSILRRFGWSDHICRLPVRGKMRNNLWAWAYHYENMYDVAVGRFGSTFGQVFTEAKFLEMFEPARYKKFWREGEHGEIRDMRPTIGWIMLKAGLTNW